jgi:hypothetical protein
MAIRRGMCLVLHAVSQVTMKPFLLCDNQPCTYKGMQQPLSRGLDLTATKLTMLPYATILRSNMREAIAAQTPRRTRPGPHQDPYHYRGTNFPGRNPRPPCGPGAPGQARLYRAK